MIQRLQSLYLLAVFALMISMFFTDIVEVNYKAGENRSVQADGSIVTTRNFVDEGASINFVRLKFADNGWRFLWASFIVLILATAIPLFNIFTFRHRGFQLKLCFVEGVLLFGLLAFEVLYIKNVVDTDGAGLDIERTVEYGISSVFPLISLILVFMAGKGIIKDEALVASCDRMR